MLWPQQSTQLAWPPLTCHPPCAMSHLIARLHCKALNLICLPRSYSMVSIPFLLPCLLHLFTSTSVLHLVMLVVPPCLHCIDDNGPLTTPPHLGNNGSLTHVVLMTTTTLPTALTTTSPTLMTMTVHPTPVHINYAPDGQWCIHHLSCSLNGPPFTWAMPHHSTFPPFMSTTTQRGWWTPHCPSYPSHPHCVDNTPSTTWPMSSRGPHLVDVAPCC